MVFILIKTNIQSKRMNTTTMQARLIGGIGPLIVVANLGWGIAAMVDWG